jgi:uncharacterized membrane-anchored protein YhcB (DUF1043 family)
MSISLIELLMAVLAGMLVGIGLYWLMYRHRLSKAESLSKELLRRDQELLETREQLQHMVQRDREVSDYKGKVDDHFVETAALINQMTQSYKAVYDHLEKGAVSLVGRENLQKRLANVRSEPVKLEYIGLGTGQREDAVGYVLVLEQDLPEDEGLHQQLSEVLQVSPQEVSESLNTVMSQSTAKKLEKLLQDYGISVTLRPTPELLESSSA